MMGGKVEIIEVNILSDDDTVKEKFTYNTNGTDYAPNGTRLTSITDDIPTKNGQPSDKEQPIDDNIVDDHPNWGIRRVYKQLKNLCFPGSIKKAEREQRIKNILVSINSIEANLNHLSQDTYKYPCNKTMIENILFGIAVFTVIAIFMIPVVLYYTGPSIEDIDETMTTISFFRTCEFPTPDCLTFSESSQACDRENIAPVSFISPTFTPPTQETAEKTLTAIFNITSTSDQCNNSNPMSFFCKAAYRSCINNTSFFPIPSQCVHLQSNSCRNQWREIQSVAPTLACCNSYNPNSVCPNQFDKFCGICAPVCHEFSQFGEASTVAIQVMNGLASILGGIVCGIIVFIAAFFKRKTVFVFPNVLILYFTAVLIIYGFFAALPLFWREDLLCSDRNLFIAIFDSSTFCQIQGFALDATIMIFTEFWILFVFHLFVKIMDPLKSWVINRPEHTTKVHIIEVTLVILIGLIVPIITISTTDGYSIGIFPPSQCFSDPEIFFHGIMLPTIIMCIVGISLILFTFLHIHRTTGIFKRMKKKRTFVLSVPEVKLLLISFYLTLVLGASLIQFTLNVRTLNDRIDAIMDYSYCVANGNCNCEDEREMVEDASIPETAFLFLIANMFLNLSNLLFIIQFQDVKHMARRATRNFLTTELS